MPNAKDLKVNTGAARSIFALGLAGAGKTTQLLTLPGKKFVYMFDPNGMASLAGYDIDYELFLPEEVSLKLTSMSGDGKKKAQEMGQAPIKNFSGEAVYAAWEKDFEQKIKDGFFSGYDVLVIDSFTTLSDLVMDGVLAINGRGGQWPQQDDYAPQMLALRNIIRQCTALGLNIYVTGHIEPIQDGLTKRVFYQALMTGKLKTKLPLLFSDLLVFSAEGDSKGNVNYKVQTAPDSMNPSIRTATKGLNMFEVVTLDFSKPLVGQGLGKLLKLT